MMAGAVGILVLTALTTFLPWTSKDGVDTWGLGHDDAFLVLAACGVGVAMVNSRIKAAWIAPGFAAVVQIRDINRVRDTDFDVGLGLWLGTALALAAVFLLLADLILGIQRSASTEGPEEIET